MGNRFGNPAAQFTIAGLVTDGPTA